MDVKHLFLDSKENVPETMALCWIPILKTFVFVSRIDFKIHGVQVFGKRTASYIQHQLPWMNFTKLVFLTTEKYTVYCIKTFIQKLAN